MKHLPEPVVARVPGPWRWTWTDFAGLGLDAFHEVARLRQEVFVVEQRCAYLDLTGADREAWHLCGWHLGADAPALGAYARVFAPGAYDGSAVAVVGRVVVAPSLRGRGLGRAVVAEALARRFADAGRPEASKLSAQAHLETLYASLGYVTDGPGFLEDDIPHLPMARAARPAPPVRLVDEAGALVTAIG